MRKTATIILLLLTIAGTMLAVSRRNVPAKTGATQDRKVLYYVDPMNPSHTSDKPGRAPCGMAMEPVYADEGMPASMPPGAVKINAQKQQILGVRVGPVEATSRTRSFRTIGRVAPDETRLHRVIAGTSGFVREISDVTTDSYVRKDQWLASFSSPDSIPSIQAYIVALNAMERLREDNAGRSAESLESGATYQLRVEKLQEMGISPAQMEEIKQTRAVPRKINILSPADGFVLTREISTDQKFDRGAEWFRIADLSRVWIVAEVYDPQDIQPGMRARVSLPQQERVFEATVTQASPRFDASQRAMKVRLEADNPENVLRPDMLVDVEFHVILPPALTVPLEAVLDSGREQLVFVDRGEGAFEPRQVKTGRRLEEGVEILSGLTEGERIALSGTFLIDSESRMKLAAAGFHGEAAKDPVCGMDVDEARAAGSGLVVVRDGKTYSFCSEECKGEFEQQPERYARPRKAPKENAEQKERRDSPPRQTHRQATVSPAPSVSKMASSLTRDPVCGMLTQESRARAQHLTSERDGKTHYFCSRECKVKFDKTPQRYTAQAEAADGSPEGHHP